jgi:hypothetical protein
MAAEELFGHDSSKPLKGDYVGAYVSVKGDYVPITIHIDDVDKNGSLRGSFALDPTWPGAKYLTVGPFQSGRYSQFGTMHLDENVVDTARGTTANLVVRFDGRFAAPTSTVGTIWGTVSIMANVQEGSSQETVTGTLSVSYTKKLRPPIKVTAQSGIWDDGA